MRSHVKRGLAFQIGSRQGTVIIFMVAGMVMLLAMVMISVDVAMMQLVRAELRAASDSAANAGAECLLRTQDKTQAVNAALAFAQLNNVGGKPFKLKTTDVVIGTQRCSPTVAGPFLPEARSPTQCVSTRS